MDDRQAAQPVSLAALATGAPPAEAGLGLPPARPKNITLLYAGLGALWILLSDRLLGLVIGLESLAGQSVKGLAFIVVTAGSLYLILRHYLKRSAVAEAQVEAFGQSFRDFAESASDWLWETGPDLRFTYVSDRYAEITGHPPDYLIGQSRGEIMDAGIEPALRRTHLEDLAARRPFQDFVYPFRDAHGALRWFRVSGKPVRDPEGAFLGYRGVGRDVTDRVGMRAARDRLAAIVEASPEFIGTATDEGCVLYLNRAARLLWGIGADEDVRALRVDDFHPPGALALLRDEAMPAAADGGVWSDRTALLTRGGEIVPVHQIVIAHPDEAGEVRCYSTVMRDLRGQIEAEERARTAQKMEALGQLTGGVAHDFNNLLTVILGNVDLLTDQLAHDPALRTLAETAKRAGERGADLTNRLLAFARRQALHPRPTDVAALLAGMDPLLRRTLGEQVEFAVAPAVEAPWRAQVDAAQLESALLNLCLNAREAMPQGGRLTVETANVHIDADHAGRHEELEHGLYLMIAVSDTGAGMDGATLARCCEPFFTTRQGGKGSGLGLSMVFGFVKQSKGHLDISSEVGRGTTVRLYLPRAEAADEAAEVTARQAPLPLGDGERILAVEDNEMVREHVRAALEGLGYAVVTAPDGPSAMKLLEDDEPFDLLFTDVVMPGGMSGRQLAEKARALRPVLPVLFTSGYTQSAFTHQEKAGTGTDGETIHLLDKPYRRQDLAAKVREVLDGG